MLCAHVVKIHKMAENKHNITGNPEYESLWERQSVFNLPKDLISFNKNAFKPNVISFGPYHHNDEHLRSMEAHKRRSLECFLKITNTSLEQLLDSFEPMKKELMEHYVQFSDSDERCLKGDRFLDVMIRDGCFMLDILQTTTGYASEYTNNDPVFGRSAKSKVTRNEIKRDMLLIGNQLPLLVLKKLIEYNKVVLGKLKANDIEDGRITEREFIHRKIHELVLKFLESDKMHYQGYGDFEMHIQSHGDLCLHALDVLRENMIQRGTETENLFLDTEVDQTAKIKSATALSYTGVTFERNPTSSIKDIKFNNENRVLTLPRIFIDDETELTFLNLMAFERFQASKSNRVSAYIDLMDSLVRSPHDVQLLRDKEIIIAQSRGQSNPAILNLFHRLSNKVKNPIVNPDHSLDEVRKNLAGHSERHSCREKCIGMLAASGSKFKRTYCKDLLTATGFIAGTILLIFTIAQTIYTIIPYYEKGH